MKRKIIKWFFLIIWMTVIFAFSHQANSGSITHNIIADILPLNQHTIEIINIIIRKLAHLTEYFILAIAIHSLLKEYLTNIKTITILSLIFCIIYATTDEYHQSFITNRTSSPKDVLIDTIGSLTYLTMATIYHIQKSKKNTP